MIGDAWVDILYSIIAVLVSIIFALSGIVWHRVSSHMEEDETFQKDVMGKLEALLLNQTKMQEIFSLHLEEARKEIGRLNVLEQRVNAHDIRIGILERFQGEVP